MKRIVIGIFAAALLFSLGGAMAGNAGTSSDPLVSQSYIDSTFKPDVVEDGNEAVTKGLTAVYDSALAELEESYDGFVTALGGSDYLLATAQDQYNLAPYATVTGITGTSVIAVSGEIRVSVNKGTVINIATGEEVSSGTVLTPGMRYFCAEDTEAVFTAYVSSSCAVNGKYKVSSGATKAFTAYADVNPDEWYFDEAKYVYDNNLFYDARTENTFREAEEMTRAEIVYAIWRLAGSPAPKTTATYVDLKENWYLSAVSWASENGIVEGYDGNRFGANDKVTREQIACFMYRYADHMGHSLINNADLSVYTDAGKISDWALEEMKWANRQGLITGNTNTTIWPQGTATRSQIAAILMRYAT